METLLQEYFQIAVGMRNSTCGIEHDVEVKQCL